MYYGVRKPHLEAMTMSVWRWLSFLAMSNGSSVYQYVHEPRQTVLLAVEAVHERSSGWRLRMM